MCSFSDAKAQLEQASSEYIVEVNHVCLLTAGDAGDPLAKQHILDCYADGAELDAALGAAIALKDNPIMKQVTVTRLVF